MSVKAWVKGVLDRKNNRKITRNMVAPMSGGDILAL